MLHLPRPGPTPRLISLTPLIDVVFILLVFFMLASSFLDWRAVELQLPATASVSAPAEAIGIAVVSIDDVGALALDGMPFDEAELLATLARRLDERLDLRVLVRTSDGVSLQQAVNLLERIGDAGVGQVSLARQGTQQP